MVNTAQLNANDLEGFNKGDSEAFTRIVEAFYKAIYFFAKQFVSPEDAEEIVQDTFFTLWRRQGSFGEVSNIQAFLFITTRNACLNKLRALKTQEALHNQLSLTVNEEDTVLQARIKTETMELLLNALHSLPGKNGRILRLLILEKLDTKQVAEKTGMTVEAVRKAKSRAIMELRIKLVEKHVLTFIIMLLSYPFTQLLIFLKKCWS